MIGSFERYSTPFWLSVGILALALILLEADSAESKPRRRFPAPPPYNYYRRPAQQAQASASAAATAIAAASPGSAANVAAASYYGAVGDSFSNNNNNDATKPKSNKWTATVSKGIKSQVHKLSSFFHHNSHHHDQPTDYAAPLAHSEAPFGSNLHADTTADLRPGKRMRASYPTIASGPSYTHQYEVNPHQSVSPLVNSNYQQAPIRPMLSRSNSFSTAYHESQSNMAPGAYSQQVLDSSPPFIPSSPYDNRVPQSVESTITQSQAPSSDRQPKRIPSRLPSRRTNLNDFNNQDYLPGNKVAVDTSGRLLPRESQEPSSGRVSKEEPGRMNLQRNPSRVNLNVIKRQKPLIEEERFTLNDEPNRFDVEPEHLHLDDRDESDTMKVVREEPNIHNDEPSNRLTDVKDDEKNNENHGKVDDVEEVLPPKGTETGEPYMKPPSSKPMAKQKELVDREESNSLLPVSENLSHPEVVNDLKKGDSSHEQIDDAPSSGVDESPPTQPSNNNSESDTSHQKEKEATSVDALVNEVKELGDHDSDKENNPLNNDHLEEKKHVESTNSNNEHQSLSEEPIQGKDMILDDGVLNEEAERNKHSLENLSEQPDIDEKKFDNESKKINQDANETPDVIDLNHPKEDKSRKELEKKEDDKEKEERKLSSSSDSKDDEAKDDHLQSLDHLNNKQVNENVPSNHDGEKKENEEAQSNNLKDSTKLEEEPTDDNLNDRQHSDHEDDQDDDADSDTSGISVDDHNDDDKEDSDSEETNELDEQDKDNMEDGEVNHDEDSSVARQSGSKIKMRETDRLKRRKEKDRIKKLKKEEDKRDSGERKKVDSEDKKEDENTKMKNFDVRENNQPKEPNNVEAILENASLETTTPSPQDGIDDDKEKTGQPSNDETKSDLDEVKNESTSTGDKAELENGREEDEEKHDQEENDDNEKDPLDDKAIAGITDSPRSVQDSESENKNSPTNPEAETSTQVPVKDTTNSNEPLTPRETELEKDREKHEDYNAEGDGEKQEEEEKKNRKDHSETSLNEEVKQEEITTEKPNIHENLKEQFKLKKNDEKVDDGEKNSTSDSDRHVVINNTPNEDPDQNVAHVEQHDDSATEEKEVENAELDESIKEQESEDKNNQEEKPFVTSHPQNDSNSDSAEQYAENEEQMDEDDDDEVEEKVETKDKVKEDSLGELSIEEHAKKLERKHQREQGKSPLDEEDGAKLDEFFKEDDEVEHQQDPDSSELDDINNNDTEKRQDFSPRNDHDDDDDSSSASLKKDSLETPDEKLPETSTASPTIADKPLESNKQPTSANERDQVQSSEPDVEDDNGIDEDMARKKFKEIERKREKNRRKRRNRKARKGEKQTDDEESSSLSNQLVGKPDNDEIKTQEKSNGDQQQSAVDDELSLEKPFDEEQNQPSSNDKTERRHTKSSRRSRKARRKASGHQDANDKNESNNDLEQIRSQKEESKTEQNELELKKESEDHLPEEDNQEEQQPEEDEDEYSPIHTDRSSQGYSFAREGDELHPTDHDGQLQKDHEERYPVREKRLENDAIPKEAKNDAEAISDEIKAELTSRPLPPMLDNKNLKRIGGRRYGNGKVNTNRNRVTKLNNKLSIDDKDWNPYRDLLSKRPGMKTVSKSAKFNGQESISGEKNLPQSRKILKDDRARKLLAKSKSNSKVKHVR